MEEELNIIKLWGIIYIVLMIIGGLILSAEIGGIFGLIMIVSASIFAFILYIICSIIKAHNIIIEQNKEIIKQLSK